MQQFKKIKINIKVTVEPIYVDETCKVCTVCNTLKSIDCFGPNKRNKDNKQPQCKECRRESAIELYKIKILDPLWAEKDKERKKGKKLSTEKHNEYSNNKRKKHPLKYKARAIVCYLIRSGQLQKMPCEICNHKEAEAHHDDYNFPYNIRWLCKDHHMKHHRKYNRERII